MRRIGKKREMKGIERDPVQNRSVCLSRLILSSEQSRPEDSFLRMGEDPIKYNSS